MKNIKIIIMIITMTILLCFPIRANATVVYNELDDLESLIAEGKNIENDSSANAYSWITNVLNYNEKHKDSMVYKDISDECNSAKRYTSISTANTKSKIIGYLMYLEEELTQNDNWNISELFEEAESIDDASPEAYKWVMDVLTLNEGYKDSRVYTDIKDECNSAKRYTSVSTANTKSKIIGYLMYLNEEITKNDKCGVSELIKKADSIDDESAEAYKWIMNVLAINERYSASSVYVDIKDECNSAKRYTSISTANTKSKIVAYLITLKNEIPVSGDLQNVYILDNAVLLSEEGADITFRTNTGDAESDTIRWFKFVPEETNFFTFLIDNPIVVYSASDTSIYFYSSLENASNDKKLGYSYGKNNKVTHTIKMNKGEAYYIKIEVPSYYNKDTDYNMTLSISKETLPLDNSLTLVDVGTCGDNLKWLFYDNGLLDIYGTGNMTQFGYGSKPWDAYSNRIKSVKIEEGVTSIGSMAFREYSEISKPVVFPSTLKSIGDYAFYECTGMVGEVVFNDKLEAVGKRSFYGCTGLNGDLSFPDSVTSVGEYAFSGCTGFNGNIRLSDSITEISEGVFYGCVGINGGLNIPETVETIGDYAFRDCTGMTGGLVFNDKLETIGNGSFYGCTGLTGNIYIPNSVASIGESAFRGCTGFSGSISISKSITEIKDYTFRGCTGIKGGLDIPDSVTKIGNYAFYDCSGLSGSILIPEGVISVGEYAFYDCVGFKGKLSLPTTLTKIGSRAFSGDKNLTGDLNLPVNLTTIGASAFSGCGKITGSVIIPDKITIIENKVFYDCSSLNGHISLSSQITSVGEEAFYNCSSLTGDLIIPNSVSVINSSAFSRCEGLESLSIGNNVSSIGSYAFSGCEGISGELKLPENLTKLDGGAFYNCKSLSGTLKIPSMITSLGNSIIGEFENCINLENIVLHGDISFKTDEAFEGCKKAAFYVAEGSESDEYVRKNHPDNIIHYLSTDDLLNLNLHVYSDWIVEKEATCTENGKRVKNCSGCNQVITETIPALGHSLAKTDYKVPTCTNTGNSTYYTCTRCNKHFSDDKGTNEMEKDSWVIAALGHSYGTPTYTWSDDNKTCKAEKICIRTGCNENVEDHSVTEIVTTTSEVMIPTTCTEKGIIEFTAVFNGANFAKQTREDYIPTNTHTLTKTDAKAATCTEAGNREYYTCTRCNKHFSDDKGTDEVEKDSWVLAAIGHNYSTPTYKWSDDGKSCVATSVCSNDNSHVITETVVYEENSEYSKIKASVKDAATIDKMGTTTYTATFDNKLFTEQIKDIVDIEKIQNHSVDNPSKDATNIQKDNSIIDDKTASQDTKESAQRTDTSSQNTDNNTPASKTTNVTKAEGTSLPIIYAKAEVVVTSKEGETPTVEYKTIIDDEIENAVIPSSVTVDGISYAVTTIAKEAFKDNTAVKNVTIPDSIIGIGDSAFESCTSLEGINIPNSVIEIGENAFYGCSSLKTVKLGNKVTSIKAGAFAGNTALTKITIPASVKSIRKNAFKGCKKLKNVTIKTTKLTKKSVGANAFKNINKKVIVKVPKKKLKEYKKILKKVGISSKSQKVK